ncbi:16S rRNA (cytidine(1402)-2'-O)-methyltransferase [Bordetella bronchiseptica F2]|nr:16S rRNA (cytidine(1402)-2'-O)-methyltransferase [Bordetella bronchiseptica F2]KDC56269.1 16S rRNA (cytidine(1402)-2'-O)-methyltransferase [Bordetella bronchiseptica MBORD591]
MQAALGLGGAGEGQAGGGVGHGGRRKGRCRATLAQFSPSQHHAMNQDVLSPAPGDAWSRVADRVAAQHWPAATLYVIATPIGNLGDLGLRAWQALVRADVIAAEDTRASRTLLDAWGVSTPLMAAHRHNEASAAQAICERLAQGQRVALVSDAGAPAVSDPGARIVRAVREAGYAVVPVPGPSAVIAALMGSGATSDENPAFAFAGFPPVKAVARQRWLRQWCALPAPVVMFESPHRLAATLADLREAGGPARLLTVARELTKRFEEIATMPLGEAADWLAADAHRGQGEFVLIVHQAPGAQDDEADPADPRTDALLDALLESLSVRDAARVAAKVTGLARDVLYARALARKEQP